MDTTLISTTRTHSTGGTRARTILRASVAALLRARAGIVAAPGGSCWCSTDAAGQLSLLPGRERERIVGNDLARP